jgi:hypothetical protein
MTAIIITLAVSVVVVFCLGVSLYKLLEKSLPLPDEFPDDSQFWKEPK